MNEFETNLDFLQTHNRQIVKQIVCNMFEHGISNGTSKIYELNDDDLVLSENKVKYPDILRVIKKSSCSDGTSYWELNGIKNLDSPDNTYSHLLCTEIVHRYHREGKTYIAQSISLNYLKTTNDFAYYHGNIEHLICKLTPFIKTYLYNKAAKNFNI